MSSEYKSIETVFVRNPVTHTLELGNIREDAFEAIGSWVVTEKIDGMNIRAIFRLATSPSGESYLHLEVRGRTDKALLPPGVKEAVERAFPESGREVIKLAWAKELGKGQTVTFYGEAFGDGIQGNPLRLAGKRFRVFDILIGTSKWLNDVDIRSLAEPIGFTAVPLIGLINRIPKDEGELIGLAGTSKVATEYVRPEGIVARPILPLFDTWGNRVVWKLTFREFDKLDALARAEAAKGAVVGSDNSVRMPEPVL